MVAKPWSKTLHPKASVNRVAVATAPYRGRWCSPAAEKKMASAKTEEHQATEVHEEKQYNEVKGDLFSCPDSYSLAHCISADCHMGKGIAVLFRKKFKGQDELLSQNKKTGDVAILKRGDRFIYYLITKNKFSQKPTYDTLKLSLQAMREHCRTHKITHLAMPKIGCGLDRLRWPIVSEIIKDMFSDTEVKITIYYQ